MLSEKLAESLHSYRVGPKIRTLRTQKSLGLAQLGEHTGLSAGMLSKIERGQVIPTLPTLMKIAMVFGVGLEHFFDESHVPVVEVVRAQDRLTLPNTREGEASFFFGSLDFPANDRPIDAFVAEFPTGAPASKPHDHDGHELIYVISGALELGIHGKSHVLEARDSMFFDSGFPHTYACVSEMPAIAVVVAVKKIA